MEVFRSSGFGKHSRKRLCKSSPVADSLCDKDLYIVALVLEARLHSQIQKVHNFLWGASIPFVGVLSRNVPLRQGYPYI